LAVAVIAAGGLCGCGSRRSPAELEAALRPAAIDATPATGGPTQTAPGQVPGDGSSTAVPPSKSAANGLPPKSVGAPNGTSTAPGQPGSGGGSVAAGHPQDTSGNATGTSVAVSVNQPVPGIESNCATELAPVAIGSVGEQSGLAGAAVGAGAQTVAAWAGYVNSLGGLRCHPIKFVAADDGGDPSRNEALTQELVDQDGVVAFVYNDAPLASEGSLQFLVQHHIPAIGTGGLEQFYLEHPNLFPQVAVGTGAVLAGMEGIVGQLTGTQRSHLGLVSCIEAAECSQAGKDSPKFAHRLGVKIVYNGSASLTAPDYTSQCLAAKRAGVQVLTLVLDPSSIHRAAANCRAAGYTGLFATVSIVITPDDSADPNLNHMVFGSPVKPWVSTSNPQIALMDRVLAKYAPGVSPVGSPGLGWTAAQLFAASSVYWPATARITSADILAAMDRIAKDDVGGMTGPLTFTRGHNATSTLCGFQMAIENGKYISPDNGARACL
jgi:branched-chain amino acid transport system substrate-binding protein